MKSVLTDIMLAPTRKNILRGMQQQVYQVGQAHSKSRSLSTKAAKEQESGHKILTDMTELTDKYTLRLARKEDIPSIQALNLRYVYVCVCESVCV
jgi:hypothetical protein